MTGRRHFLGVLAAAAAGHTLDVDRLLWVPGARTFVLPPAGGWEQAYTSIDQATMELLRMVLARHARRRDALPWTHGPSPLCPARLGEGGMTHQCGIDMEVGGSISRRAHLDPAAESLETYLHQHQLTHFRALALPNVSAPDVCVVHSPQLSIRGIRQWDPELQGLLLRFDVLAAGALTG